MPTLKRSLRLVVNLFALCAAWTCGPSTASAQTIGQSGGTGMFTFSLPLGVGLGTTSIETLGPTSHTPTWVRVVSSGVLSVSQSGVPTYFVSYAVDPNPTNLFRGALISNSTGGSAVIQQGCAAFEIGGLGVGARGDQMVLRVVVPPTDVPPETCMWGPITTADSWLTITRGGSGTGLGTIELAWDANLTTTERVGTLVSGVPALTVRQSISTSFLVFRESKLDSKRGTFGTKDDEIPGIDHVGFSWEGLVYESHPGYPANTVDPNGNPVGRYMEGADADDDDFIEIIKLDGVQSQHSLKTFEHDSTTSQTHTSRYEAIQVDTAIGNKLVERIESVRGKAFLGLPPIETTPLDVLFSVLSPANQKGGNGEFTCVGLVEWAAEQAGVSFGQGFIPNVFESFLAPYLGDTLFISVPTLTPELLLYAAQGQAKLFDAKRWVQALFDPVDFLITDPIGRRLGFVEGVGIVREIPGAFYPGNGKLEHVLIPDALPGTYSIRLVGVGAEVWAAVDAAGAATSVARFLGRGEEHTVEVQVSPAPGAAGDVDGNGEITNGDVTALLAVLGATAVANDAGDLDRDLAITNNDVLLLRRLVSASTVENEPPVVEVPANITKEATGPGGATVDFTVDATDDDTPGPVVCTSGSGAVFPIGTTSVSCSSIDSRGAEGTADFLITVRDSTPPGLTVPNGLSLTATGPAGASLSFAASAIDLVDGTIAPTCVPAPGAMIPVGSSVVTCSARDRANNLATASFSVIVSPGSPANTAAEQMNALFLSVINDSKLPANLKTALASRIQEALSDFDPANLRQRKLACLSLSLFMSLVRAHSGRTIPRARAEQYILDATRIRRLLGC
jgi:HYR domain